MTCNIAHALQLFQPNNCGLGEFYIVLKQFSLFRFNVRRHQMLYCVRKDEINPKDLGLGKTQDEETENGAVASKGTYDP